MIVFKDHSKNLIINLVEYDLDSLDEVEFNL